MHEELGYRFDKSVVTVDDIITSWIQFMFLQFSKLRTQGGNTCQSPSKS